MKEGFRLDCQRSSALISSR